MSDLISRQAAIDTALTFLVEYCGAAFDKDMQKMLCERLDALPSAEPEIIRCKDCKHYNAGFECLIEGYGIERNGEWYCGDAERRRNDE